MSTPQCLTFILFHFSLFSLQIENIYFFSLGAGSKWFEWSVCLINVYVSDTIEEIDLLELGDQIQVFF